MNDAQLLRYSRHILLNELGVEGQELLLASHALVIGAGGLGSPVALYLGSAGVGRITVVDHDVVDETNLQRQIAHNLARVGSPKAASVREAIAAINPDVIVTPMIQRADAALLDALVPDADVVIDCTDNFATRHTINRACVRHHKPLVSGAAIRMDGQLSVFDQRTPGNPCYACVFPETSDVEETRCATMGVFAPLVGIVGTMQAAEALKLLTGLGSRLTGQLLMIDGRDMAFNQIALPQNPMCAVCGHPHR
ncbi:MAG: molybdopterin biosynthesis protein MoeB [Burkholderiales bacterium RIFCSPLOWO2_12_67_14]|nr:MAG: molybdopterin biosynthesis protein MoeB [Burkholderiales bacterium RIFCSPLOWO2_02_FULL_67_64]OGB37907.1 MAG: molybdopterin biosynthesis protein MoeB [Burkholderiales bacterium RIFCSPHIGHO2_12_FULL_67_38]OGB49833.1 MAG: molybdopterin biosynthesis protein MoeB [Burkholderiales bacterium RIFCSPLOWO2_12_67_14]OGB76641.1 MAG: molybdopterin biosynthesis protein MoeB [Burkholderiales bacterium RIFCSPLOWO2_12_FULL_67_210]